MNNIKDFFKDIKKTAYLALISYIIICFFNIKNIVSYGNYYFDFSSMFGITRLISLITDFAFLIYFIIIINRFKTKKGNVKAAQKFLLISIVALTILNFIIEIYYIYNYGFDFRDLRSLVINLIYCWYFVGLFKNIKCEINNKWFAGIIIVNFLYVQFLLYKFSFISFLLGILSLLYLPYFYRYYDIKNNK